MKNILVAISLSQDAKQLFDQAVKIAKSTGGKLWIVHVSKADPEDLLLREAGPQYLYEKRAEDREKAKKFVEQEAKEITKNHDVPAEGLLIQGSITKTIKNMVNKYNINLVVAGQRKKKFFI